MTTSALGNREKQLRKFLSIHGDELNETIHNNRYFVILLSNVVSHVSTCFVYVAAAA